MSGYIIAPKREARNRVSGNWENQLRLVEGVEIIGCGPVRIQIRASSSAIEKVREILGEDFLIEALIEHNPLTKS